MRASRFDGGGVGFRGGVGLIENLLRDFVFGYQRRDNAQDRLGASAVCFGVSSLRLRGVELSLRSGHASLGGGQSAADEEICDAVPTFLTGTLRFRACAEASASARSALARSTAT